MLYFSHANLRPNQVGWCLSDFENRAVDVWGHGTVTVDLITVQNTQIAWQKATSTNSDCMCRIYAVDLSDDTDPDAFIENLQYFFIRADRVSNPGLDSPQLGLLVQGNQEDISRARAYLSMLSNDNARYNLLYCIVENNGKSGEANIGKDNDKDKNNDEEEQPLCCPIFNPFFVQRPTSDLAGRFMPLLHIVSPNPKQRSGVLYSGDVLLSELCSTEEDNGASLGSKLSAEELAKCYETYDSIKMIPRRGSVKGLCLVYWYRILDDISGTTGSPLNDEKKEALRKELTEFVLEKRKYMSLLAELYWLFILSSMMVDKMFLKKDGKQTVLDKHVLHQSYLDTLNYTDGIIQLLENSCQHSLQESCYVSMRLLFVKRDVSDLQLIQNVRARETLMNRYHKLSQCKLSLDPHASYYVDISIVDDARISTNKVSGILQVYRKNARDRYGLSEGRLPRTLEDVFSDDHLFIDMPDGIVHHYGLDSLKQVISKNGGLFLVSSPDTEINPGSQTTEVVCYPIPSDPEKKPIPHQNLDDTTEYHILYPLRSHSQLSPKANEKEDLPNTSKQYPFEFEDIVNGNIKTKTFKFHDIFKTENHLLYLDQASKIDLVNRAVTQCHQKLFEDNWGQTLTNTELEDLIFLFDIRGINSLELELFTKFVFRLIADENRKKSRRLFAVYFDNCMNQQEFIRLFAVFYRRVRKMENRNLFSGAQVALCSTHTISEKPLRQVPEVNLILNAKNWNSLFESARQFAYCNLESAQKVISQIQYFSRCDAGNSIPNEDASLFPFDLYLQNTMNIPQDPASPISVAKTSQCWFLQRIAHYMQMDLQGEHFGLKLSDSHFYLRSNIHLEAFYQAELLFHNISYVWRFAYLVAKRIVESSCPFENHLLICYEAYSALLAQYITEYLTDVKSHAKVEYAIMYQEKPDEMTLLLPELLKKDFSCSSNSWGFTYLYPAGTTLSTLHAMHECTEKECGIKVSSANSKDIVLILVSPTEESIDLQRRYLEVNSHQSMSPLQQARVQLLSRYGNEKWDVDYFLIARTKWHDPFDCGKTDRGRPIVYTDRTSTQLNMIFPPKTADSSSISENRKNLASYWEHIHKHDVCSMLKYSERKTNEQRLKLLATCIHYGHITRDHNHYSYYLNFPRYFEIIKESKLYQAWLDDLQKRAVDPRAFNIIVTPLRSDRSPLLMDLTRSVFAHCAHILQLDLHNVRRTDIRTKYRFIVEECAELLHDNPSARINVYYADSSIVTSESLHRGLSLVQMLLRDRIPIEKEIHLYQGIFVLVNRSSKDTVLPFIKNPATDYHAFVHLAIPHYNTRSGICPSCKLIEKYEELGWRSATNSFVEEYQRLIDKNKARTYKAHKEWKAEQLWKSPGAFLRLRQWLYHFSNSDFTKAIEVNNPYAPDLETIEKAANYLIILQKRFYDQFCEDFDIDKENFIRLLQATAKRQDAQSETEILRQAFLTRLDQLSLEDLIPPQERKSQEVKSLQEVWTDCVVSGHAYRRLMCTHHAYERIPLEVDLMSPTGDHTEAINEMKQFIIDYLEKEMKQASSPVERWEYLHSCLKVLSRDNLARYRTVREAIFDLLHDAADLMLGITPPDAALSKSFCVGGPSVGIPTLGNKRCKKITPLLRYQMFICILRRLSDMQSNYPVIRLSDNKICAQLGNLLSFFFEEARKKDDGLDALFCCPIPSMQRMLFAYEKCIKLTTMAGDEKNKSILILQKYESTP